MRVFVVSALLLLLIRKTLSAADTCDPTTTTATADTMNLSDEVQLGYALEAFGRAKGLDPVWAITAQTQLLSAGISSMNDLRTGCQDSTVNLDLELFGIPKEDRFSEETLQYLQSFLPGPVGLRCFRLARKAAQKVKKGTADTEYVHRPESGKRGKETWKVPAGDDWTIHVDCAGFVRNCLKHVTKDPFVMLLSDRDFMRAKDFYGFFQTIPYTVLDKEEIPFDHQHMKWRIVPDLRLVIPGDVIVYRPRGNAAGGAAFTTNDRRDLGRLLTAVKTAQLWHEQATGGGDRITRNLAKDPLVAPWVAAVKAKLQAAGIYTVKSLRMNLESLNDKLRAAEYSALYQDTISLMKECSESVAMNTGHIVFAAGPAKYMGDNEYRFRIVHSTKYGKLDANGEVTTGVQEYFRRFTLVEGPDGKERWTRQMKSAPLPEDMAAEEEEEDPNDDMEEDGETGGGTSGDEAEEQQTDELSGCGEVEVLAARMCF
jgi:hypothetical protein